MSSKFRKILIIVIVIEILGYICSSLCVIKQKENILFEAEYNAYSLGRGPRDFQYKIYKNGLVIRKFDKIYWVDYIGVINTIILKSLSNQIFDEYYENPYYGSTSDCGESKTIFYSEKENRLLKIASGDFDLGYWKFYNRDYYKDLERLYKEFGDSGNINLYIGFFGSGVIGSNTSNIAKIVIYYTRILYYLFFIKVGIILILIIRKIVKIRRNNKENKIVEN